MSSAVHESESSRKRGEIYAPSPPFLRGSLGILAMGAVGNADIEITGIEHVKKVLSLDKSDGRGIIAGSHINNTDLTISAHLVSRYANVVFAVQSTNRELWHQRWAYKVLGDDRFFSVDWRHSSDKSSLLIPGHFNPENYADMVQAIDDGKTPIVAAHNPSAQSFGLEMGMLPSSDKAGVLAPFLSLTTGAPIIPALVEFEGQREHPEWNNMNSLDASFLLRKKAVHIGFGDALYPDEREGETYHALIDEKRKSRAELSQSAAMTSRVILKRFGAKVMDSLHDMQMF